MPWIAPGPPVHAMANAKLNACIQSVGEAERALSQLFVVQKQLSDTRKVLEQIMVDDGNVESCTPRLDTPPPEAAAVAVEVQVEARGASEIVAVAVGDTATHDPIAPQDREDSGVLVADLSGSGNLSGSGKYPSEISTKSKSATQKADLEEISRETAIQLGLSVDDVMKAYDVFRDADKDNSGNVNVGELLGMLSILAGTTIKQSSIEKVLDRYDKNGDGELNFEEFLFCYCFTPGKKAAHLRAAADNPSNNLGQKFRTIMVGSLLIS